MELYFHAFVLLKRGDDFLLTVPLEVGFTVSKKAIMI
jgi:hypothetical protein